MDNLLIINTSEEDNDKITLESNDNISIMVSDDETQTHEIINNVSTKSSNSQKSIDDSFFNIYELM